MAPFEVLYGRKCRTPLNWSEIGDSQIFGPDILKEAEEKVHKIREHLKTAQSRYKSYADKRRRELTFNIGDFVYLKVSPLKGMQRFQLRGKLAPRYVGPFKFYVTEEKYHINWNCPRKCQRCMMCFTSRYFGSVWKFPRRRRFSKTLITELWISTKI